MEHLNTQLARELHILEHVDTIVDTLYTLVTPRLVTTQEKHSYKTLQYKNNHRYKLQMLHSREYNLAPYIYLHSSYRLLRMMFK